MNASQNRSYSMTGRADHVLYDLLPGSTVVTDSFGVIRVDVPAADLESVVHRLAGTPGIRLADLFASAARDGTVMLHVLWALDTDQRYLMLKSLVTGNEYPALSDIAPAAFVEECEIYEQFGIRPSGGKPLNRVVVPPQSDHDVPRLGQAPTEAPRDVHAPHAVGGHAFEFPFGPVRMTGAESLYFGLVTSGEEVVDLYLFTWHKFRGLEWRLAGLDPRRALFLVERVEGLSAVATSWAFAAAVEQALGLTPTEEACRTRAVALELERMYNHAAAIVALCQATGLSVGQAGAEIALERLLRVNAATFGHRYLFGVMDIGGVRRGPDLAALEHDLPGIVAELRAVTDALATTNSFLDRLEATGVLDSEQATRLGLVGPVARATGIDTDVRSRHPYPPYDVVAAPPVLRTGGDVLSRFQIFVQEIEQSVRLIEQLAAGAAASPVQAVPEAAGEGLGWAESPRGETLAYVQLGHDGRLTRARIRPGSVRNWRGFDDACRSQNVFTDIEIIEASFWLTVAGAAH